MENGTLAENVILDNRPTTYDVVQSIPAKIVLINENAKIPTYGTPGAAGFDIYSAVECTVLSNPTRIKTGFKIEIPPHHGLFIIPRSGAAFKELYVANSPGLIDSDYRGEVMVLAWSNNSSGYKINIGDRIAQGIILPIFHTTFTVVDELSDTVRGEGGFGHTGV